MKQLKNCVSYFKSNPFFRRTVILYVITGCVIFFLFGTVTILGISKASFSQMNATEQKMLEQSCNTANLILRDIHSLANNKFTEDPAIQAAMLDPYSVSTSQNVQNAFSNIMSSSSLIDSLYVVNYKYDIVYSTQTSAKKTTDFFDSNIMTYLAATPAKSDIFFSRTATLTNDITKPETVNYITSVYRTAKDFALVVNISQEEFQSLVNLASDRESYETVVLDSDGFVISHSSAKYFAENKSEDPLFAEIMNNGKGSGSFKFQGAIVNFVRSNILGYFYISISTANNPLGSFGNLLIYLTLFTILLLLVYLICSVLASLSTYTVFNTLKKNIYNLFNKNADAVTTENEIETISHLLQEAKTRYNAMETIQYQYANSKQNSTLKKLLNGTFSYLQDDMKSCNIDFPYQGFAVLVVRIDGMSKMDSDTVYMIRYAVMNMGKEVFETAAKAYTAETNDYDVTFILNFMNPDFIRPVFDKLNSYLKEFFEATVSCGYDTAVTESLEDLSTLYHNAKYALPYRLVRGYSSLIRYSEIIPLDSISSTYPDDLEEAIVKSVTVQNKEDLVHAVHAFAGVLRQLSVNVIVLYTNRLLLALDQLSLKANPADDTEISSNIQEIVSELETLDEIESYLISKCQNLMLNFSNTKVDSKKDIMVQDVIDYIESNYQDPNLSIDMIAGKINRSANYTRSLFKQSQGISISDYIAKKRFDEVCRLLTETNLTAQEIGKQLGLNSGSYFYTSFKKHTGYTPEQYRKIHRQMR